MKTIALLSQKGGSGKTTLAINIAVAAERDGKQVVVIDLDPQASALTWRDSRESATPVVMSAQASRLGQILTAAAASGADWIIIDTTSRVESPALAAARLSDLILIPCRPSIMDLWAIRNTIDVARLAQKTAVVVLNAIPSRGTTTIEAERAVEKFGVEVCPIHLGYRAAYANAMPDGRRAQEYEPAGKAAQEISRLYTWVCKQVGT